MLHTSIALDILRNGKTRSTHLESERTELDVAKYPKAKDKNRLSLILGEKEKKSVLYIKQNTAQ